MSGAIEGVRGTFKIGKKHNKSSKLAVFEWNFSSCENCFTLQHHQNHHNPAQLIDRIDATLGVHHFTLTAIGDKRAATQSV
jgi:hypothetical protein